MNRRDVALDRGDPHAEGAGGLGLGRAALDGLDDLLAQVLGVGVHPPMMPDGPTPLQDALSHTLNGKGRGVSAPAFSSLPLFTESPRETV